MQEQLIQLIKPLYGCFFNENAVTGWKKSLNRPWSPLDVQTHCCFWGFGSRKGTTVLITCHHFNNSSHVLHWYLCITRYCQLVHVKNIKYFQAKILHIWWIFLFLGCHLCQEKFFARQSKNCGLWSASIQGYPWAESTTVLYLRAICQWISLFWEIRTSCYWNGMLICNAFFNTLLFRHASLLTIKISS